MKKIITMIAVGAFAFIGTAVESDARPRGGHGYNVPQSTIYVSGYRYGRAIYTEKYFVGHDCYGRPVFRYRTVAAPRQNYCAPSHHGYGRSHRGVSFSYHGR